MRDKINFTSHFTYHTHLIFYNVKFRTECA